jgi:glycosyltransferase involved in cell wall biosynthesis
VNAPETLRILVVAGRHAAAGDTTGERRWRDVARELVRRGHTVTVLTSRAGGRGTSLEDGVRVARELHLESGDPPSVLAAGSDCRRLRALSRDADVVVHADPTGISAALVAVRPSSDTAVVCEVTGHWLRDLAASGGQWFASWEREDDAGGRALRRVAASLLRAPVRRPEFPPGRAWFVEQEERDAYVARGLAGRDPALVRLGVDLDQFAPGDPRTGPTQVLYMGDIHRPGGLHTLVLAMGDLPRDARLRAVGDVVDGAYVAEVAELAQAARVMDRVEFGGRALPQDVPQLLQEAHVLAVPSEEPGGFPRLVLEAFATGTPVIGTPLGGRADVLREGETALTFAPGNSRELSNQLLRLLREATLRERLVRNARELVATRFALGYTVDQIERVLREEVAMARDGAGSETTGSADGGANRSRTGAGPQPRSAAAR